MKRFWFIPVALLMMLLLSIALFDATNEVEAYSWDSASTVTLTKDGTEVTPDKVYDGSDGTRKMKIYTIKSGENYTLQTSPNNDYAVFFKTHTVVYTDLETGYQRWPSLKMTFDNVTVKTKNPTQDDIDTNNNYASVYFHGIAHEGVEPKIELFLKGNNTIELNDVKNDKETNKWAALAFDKCDGPYVKSVKDTESTLNLKVDLLSSLGSVCGLRQYSNSYDNSVCFGYEYSELTEYPLDKINLNVFTKAINANTSQEYGDGLYSETSGYRLEYLTNNLIEAKGNGINIFSTHYNGVFLCGPTTIRANLVGINSYNNSVYVNNDLTITGHLNENNEYGRTVTGIYSKKNVSLTTSKAFIKSIEEAIRLDRYRDEVYDPYGSDGSTFSISKNTELTVDCAIVNLSTNDRVVYAINCTGANSNLFVNEDTKLVINAGYRAFWSNWASIYGELVINTTESLDDGVIAIGNYIQFYQLNGDNGTKINAKVDINVKADYVGLGGKYYLNSTDTIFKSAKRVLGDSVYIYRTNYTPTTYQSEDGTNWSPFSEKSTKPYLTTRTQTTHVCANDTYYAFKQNDDETTHSAKCLICDNIITENCNFVHSFTNEPSPTSDGYHYYECNVCHSYKSVTIEAHDCAQYCNSFTDIDTAHQGVCTKEGCGVTFVRNHEFTNWVKVDNLTKERTCTYCNHKETDDLHKSITHINEVASSCTSVGTKEAYHCADEDCNCFYLDSELTLKTNLESLIKPKTAHTYQEGVCLVCGYEAVSKNFIYVEFDYYSESMNGKNYIALAKHNDKYYAMGNASNEDGSRVAVEVSLNSYGAIEALDANVEIFTFEYNPISTFLADGGYMAVIDGKIVVYEKQFAKVGLNSPISYNDNYNYELDITEGNLFSSKPNDYWDRIYIYYDANTNSFKPTTSEEHSVLMYQEACSHDDGLFHQISVAPTCIEQGTKEYWRCECCDEFYVNNNLIVPFELPEGYYHYEEYFTIPAKGHQYNENGVCKNCGMKRPVYTQVTSTEALKQMPAGTSYMIIVKASDKTYAMYLPDPNPVLVDNDNNGILDILETDLDSNGVPNGIKGFDFDENGIEDYLEDRNGDGIVNFLDYEILASYELQIYYMNLKYNAKNFVEVTIREDGTIAPTNEGAMEFYLQPSGPWGRWGDEFHGGGGETPLSRKKTKSEYVEISEKSPNWWAMFIPNFWLFHSGDLGYYGPAHLSVDNRTYGDYLFPGVIDHHNWYIDIKPDGTACMVTGYYNQLYEEATLRMINYTFNGQKIQTISAFHPQAILDFTIDSSLPVYLYASIPQYAHTHTFDGWIDGQNGTHYRTCTAEECTYTERFAHTFSEWVQINENKHRRTCTVCSAYEEKEHIFGNVVHNNDNKHTKECLECHYKVEENHQFDDWQSINAKQHKRECICGHSETETHSFDKVEIITNPTHSQEGLKRHTCTKCGENYDETIPVLTDHAFGPWTLNDRDKTQHLRRCTCGEDEYDTHHFGESVVIKEATHLEEGTSRRTCKDCGYYIETTIPVLTDHTFGPWTLNDRDKTQHLRRCTCGEVEYDTHHFGESVVIKEATHLEEGTSRRTCKDCGYYIETTIPVLHEHNYGEWTPDLTTSTGHIRYCSCNESERADCTWDNGKVTIEATYEKEGRMTYTCTVCGRENHESIAMLVHTDKLVDGNYNVVINIPTDSDAEFSTNITISVNDVTNNVSEEAKSKIQIISGDGATVLASYDISLLRDGAVYQPGGKVEVTLQIPQYISDYPNFSVVFIDDDNNVTPCETKINDNGTITFITDHFSQYAIVGIPSEEGCGSCNSASVMSLFTLISLLGIVLRRRH